MAIRRRGLGVRAWLAMVAVVALVMGGTDLLLRRVHGLGRRDDHRDRLAGLGWPIGPDPAGLAEAHAGRHRDLARRFARAADRPWGPIPAEPGEATIGAVCIPLEGFEDRGGDAGSGR